MVFFFSARGREKYEASCSSRFSRLGGSEGPTRARLAHKIGPLPRGQRSHKTGVAPKRAAGGEQGAPNGNKVSLKDARATASSSSSAGNNKPAEGAQNKTSSIHDHFKPNK